MPEIVKVQIPLASTNRGAMPLVYAKGHRRMVEQTIRAATAEALGNDPKGYFEAEFAGGLWRIGKRVADQEW